MYGNAGTAALVLALLPSMAWSEKTDPLRLVPAAADAVATVPSPRALYDAVYRHELFQDFQKIEAVASFYDTIGVRRLQQLLTFCEKELGHQRLDLLDRIAGGGATLASQFERKWVLLVVEAKDEELLKQFVALTRKIANQELARQDPNAKIESRSYRDVETLHLGKELNAARAGSAILVANQESVLHQAIDLYLDGVKDSLAQSKNLAEMTGHLPKEPLVWGALNLEQVKKIQNVKNALDSLGLDPITMFAIGGLVDVIKRSPYVCAGLAREGNNLHLQVAMPRGSDGMAPLASMLLPADERGSLPLLQPPRVLSSTSYFFDLGKFWEDRHKILTPEQAKTIDKFQAETGKYLRGISLGTLLQQAGKYHRVVIAIPEKSAYKVKSPVVAGSFAVVLDMRDPAFAKSMGTILRGAALLGSFKYGLKMVEEKHGEHTLVTYYFPENGKFDGDDNNFRFNFNPCFTAVGNQFVVASTLELGKDLVDCLVQETNAITSPATQRTYVYGTGVAANLRSTEDLLISQAILGQALPAAAAKKQFAEIVRLVERAGQINFETRYTPHEFRFDVLWQYDKK